jgi:hypothetical protein
MWSSACSLRTRYSAASWGDAGAVVGGGVGTVCAGATGMPSTNDAATTMIARTVAIRIIAARDFAGIVNDGGLHRPRPCGRDCSKFVDTESIDPMYYDVSYLWRRTARLGSSDFRRNFGVDTMRHSIFQLRTSSSFKPISSDAKALDGLNVVSAVRGRRDREPGEFRL